ncbi:Exosome_complex exonuclease RRP4 [Hexamita inflata]|uniref:Exosome complex exonuclease RRP4 n=1 Tax=Hexamita inflata TaxID=28002 RepID=A0AA86UDP4_9EUKA|nr:Exosome complex exonuclease RRP4 [Hexamita inflata]CAI9949163.1 Exosome complex exonuclease RRP4 [Hexamita inflata]
MKLIEVDPLESVLPKYVEGTVFPGQPLTANSSALPGPGTKQVNGQLFATRLGVPQQTNLFVSITASSYFYEPQVGDVVIGRVSQVVPNKWLLDINSAVPGVLKIDALNLPGLQRQRDSADESNMRAFLSENDLVCVEMRNNQQVHTRNQRFGRLMNGYLIKTAVYLMNGNRHFLDVNNVSIILAKNGFVWVGGKRIGGDNAVWDDAAQDVEADVMDEIFRVIQVVEARRDAGQDINADVLEEQLKR